MGSREGWGVYISYAFGGERKHLIYLYYQWFSYRGQFDKEMQSPLAAIAKLTLNTNI